MKFIEQHIRQAKAIFEVYKGEEPLNLFLKKFFKRNKKFGSRDRKNIAEYLYAVYRLGRENRHLDFRTAVMLSLFLQGQFDSAFYQEFFPDLADKLGLELKKKVAYLIQNYEFRDAFRAMEEISAQVNTRDYRNSFYVSPKVFIRLKRNIESNGRLLEKTGKKINERCFAFDAKTKLNELLHEADYVVQDINSQETSSFFPKLKAMPLVWDCCAGSGGKAILLHEFFPDMLLTVTDIRATILENLIERFETYELGAERIMELNVNKVKDIDQLDHSFDFILCDVPCTGSGTWARTPEQAFFFVKKEIENFQKRQGDILQNVSVKLNEGGYLLYITCSVFEKENEGVVKTFLQTNPNFNEIKSDYLLGTSNEGDTLFVSLLLKS